MLEHKLGSFDRQLRETQERLGQIEHKLTDFQATIANQIQQFQLSQPTEPIRTWNRWVWAPFVRRGDGMPLG